jgi:hypothetical protein
VRVVISPEPSAVERIIALASTMISFAAAAAIHSSKITKVNVHVQNVLRINMEYQQNIVMILINLNLKLYLKNTC